MIANKGGIIVSATEPVTNRRKVWMQKGKNLFDKNSGFINAYINADGSMSSKANNNALFDFIEVFPNTFYTISFDVAIFGGSIVFYDENKIFISRKPITSTGGIVTTTNNTKYIRIFINKDNSTTMTQEIIDILNVMLNQGSEPEKYEPFINEEKIYILNDNNVYEEFMKKEKDIILWENLNVDAEFGSQIINLSTNNYKYYEIIYLLSTNNLNLVKSTGKIPKGQLAYLDYVGGAGSLIGFDRQIYKSTDYLLQISDAIRINTNVVENDRCVPVKIIGYTH